MTTKILVIRLGSMGDVILTSPAVLNLKIQFADSHLTYLTKESFAPLVLCMDGVDEIVTIPGNAGTMAYLRLLGELDGRGFDLIVDLHGNPRSWLARKLISAGRNAVYPKRRLDRYLLTRRNKTIPQEWPHTIDLYNRATEQVGARSLCRRPILKPLDTDGDAAPFGTDSDSPPTVLIAPGAMHITKQWPMERFIDVAQELHETVHARILWVVTEADAGRTGLADTLGPENFMELVDCPIVDLASIMARSDLTVANDSGLAHLSSSVGTPVVALFGPTHPALGFAPRGLHDRVVGADEFCRPCSLHGRKVCYRDRQYCFERVSADQVAATAAEMIRSEYNRQRALLIDRDGTVIVDKHYARDPDDIEFVPGAVEALRMAAADGWRLVMLSNQSGVARGIFGIEDVERMNERLLQMLLKEGVELDGLYYCPHHPAGIVPEYSHRCDCRKPGVGMAEQAAVQLGLDLRRSFVIGDKIDDFNLGRAIGAQPRLVRTGHGRAHEACLAPSFLNTEFVSDDLLQSVQKILGKV